MFLSILFLLLLSCSSAESSPKITHSISGDTVKLLITVPKSHSGKVTLYRSTVNPGSMERIDCSADPFVKWEFQVTDTFTFIDTTAAHGQRVYYCCQLTETDGSTHSSDIYQVDIPMRFIADTEGNTAIVIDKRHYTLSIYQDGCELKRYPINLGGKPKNRKLHYDNLSTPEGVYKIAHFNENSSFHRSIMVNYPNAEDRTRYENAKKAGILPIINGKMPLIGGSITIHGGGVGNNWTWGCIAMNNSDIDEIMDLYGMKNGTPILIGGWEFDIKTLLNQVYN